VVLGRVKTPRCLLVTSSSGKDGVLHTTVDLMQAFNEIHAGDEAARKAYNLSSGFYMSSLEAEALPGNNKIGYLDIWEQAPSGSTIECIPCFDLSRDEVFDAMTAEKKYPEMLLNAVKENMKVIFVPSEPSVIEGQKRWAWLEMDPETYQTISVFDTGLHSSMVEFKVAMLPTDEDTIKWLKGVWIGTNISVWSLCSSTLKYDGDYAMVWNDARNTALEIGKTVEDFFKNVDNVQKKEYGASVKLGGGSHKIDFKVGMTGFKVGLKQNMFTLGGGIKLAIDTYFKMIIDQPKKSGPPPKLPKY
jgi:hypothetical protein